MTVAAGSVRILAMLSACLLVAPLAVETRRYWRCTVCHRLVPPSSSNSILQAITLPVVIPGPSAVVNYLFLTEALDVELTVTLDDGSETVTIVDPEHIAHVKSTLAVNRAHAGSMKLNFRLSNAFSWFTDKKISYKIEAYVPRLLSKPTVLDALRRVAEAQAARVATAARVADATVQRKEAQSAVNTLGEQLAAIEAALASAVASLDAAKKEVAAADSAQSTAASDWSVRALTATLTVMLTGSHSSHEALGAGARSKREKRASEATSAAVAAFGAAAAAGAGAGDGGVAASEGSGAVAVAVAGSAPPAAAAAEASAATSAPAAAVAPAVAVALSERIGYLSPQDVCALACSCKSALMLLGSHADGLRRAAGQPSAAERSRARGAARAAALEARDAAERSAAADSSSGAVGTGSAAASAAGTPPRPAQPPQELVHHPTAAAVPFTPMQVALPAALAAGIAIGAAPAADDAASGDAASGSGSVASVSVDLAALPAHPSVSGAGAGEVIIRPVSGSNAGGAGGAGGGGALVISFADEDILAPVPSPTPSA